MSATATQTVSEKAKAGIDAAAQAAEAARPALTSTLLRTSNSLGSPPAMPLVHQLLERYLTRLAVKPLQTKMVTSGILTLLQEVLSARLAGQPTEGLPLSLIHI